ncbi:RNA 2',3'-cyclic phosphodiesterase [Blastococcus sp. Marseille-P5729]|uniref:RNA 2',3'-cyclic phosphodiesterase n=1 Tax=Blastococcus sp. Marseille-P5729 TaxID=2086582 RepID=UPI000D10BB17|nr:RNA 2',3'-cyclic phosphodiesterase [Blastococcus sp. Marseille-P5729]
MRIFTAITLPADVRDELSESLDVLREIRPDLRWVRPENLHLTVRFLGECGERELDRQIDHWEQRCAAVAPFTAAISGAGCFPHDWMAKVLYAAVELGQDPWARLAGPGQTPHVTVARSRERADLTGAVTELAGLRSRRFEVGSVVLLRSFLERGRAPRYEPLESFPLMG